MAIFEFSAPSIAGFNAQPHIEGITTIDISSNVEALKNAISKHQMHDVVGVSRTHKHLDLIDINERVVSYYDAVDNKICIDFKVVTPEMKLVPYQWIFADGKWMPVAFWDMMRGGGKEMSDHFQKFVEAKAFLSDIMVTMHQIPNASVVGLCLRFQDLLQAGTNGLTETTDHVARTQCFCKDDQEDTSDSIATHWYWNEGEEVDDTCRMEEVFCRSTACCKHIWS